MVFLDGLELLTYCIDSINKNNKDNIKYKSDLRTKGLNSYFSMQIYKIIERFRNESIEETINRIYDEQRYKPFFDNLARIANRSNS